MRIFIFLSRIDSTDSFFRSSQFGVGGTERYTYCKKCFEELPGDSVNMSDDPNSTDK